MNMIGTPMHPNQTGRIPLPVPPTSFEGQPGVMAPAVPPVEQSWIPQTQETIPNPATPAGQATVSQQPAALEVSPPAPQVGMRSPITPPQPAQPNPETEAAVENDAADADRLEAAETRHRQLLQAPAANESYQMPVTIPSPLPVRYHSPSNSPWPPGMNPCHCSRFTPPPPPFLPPCHRHPSPCQPHQHSRHPHHHGGHPHHHGGHPPPPMLNCSLALSFFLAPPPPPPPHHMDGFHGSMDPFHYHMGPPHHMHHHSAVPSSPMGPPYPTADTRMMSPPMAPQPLSFTNAFLGHPSCPMTQCHQRMGNVQPWIRPPKFPDCCQSAYPPWRPYQFPVYPHGYSQSFSLPPGEPFQFQVPLSPCCQDHCSAQWALPAPPQPHSNEMTSFPDPAKNKEAEGTGSAPPFPSPPGVTGEPQRGSPSLPIHTQQLVTQYSPSFPSRWQPFPSVDYYGYTLGWPRFYPQASSFHTTAAPHMMGTMNPPPAPPMPNSEETYQSSTCRLQKPIARQEVKIQRIGPDPPDVQKAPLSSTMQGSQASPENSVTAVEPNPPSTPNPPTRLPTFSQENATAS